VKAAAAELGVAEDVIKADLAKLLLVWKPSRRSSSGGGPEAAARSSAAL